MPATLLNTIAFPAIAPLGWMSLPHKLVVRGQSVKPDMVWFDAPGFTAIADDVNVTVTNVNPAPAAVNVCVMKFHSMIRAPGPGFVSPFIPYGGGSGGNLSYDATTFTAENKDVTPIAPGMAIAPHFSGSGIVRADVTRVAVGLATEAIAVGFSGVCRVAGVLELVDWTAATGAAALTTTADYYTAANGLISLAPPSTPGQLLQLVAKAISGVSLEIQVNPAILL